VAGLNDILLIAAVVAFCGGVLALTLIRQKDFVDASGGGRDALPPSAPGKARSETRGMSLRTHHAAETSRIVAARRPHDLEDPVS
jgi:hypothetical protein